MVWQDGEEVEAKTMNFISNQSRVIRLLGGKHNGIARGVTKRNDCGWKELMDKVAHKLEVRQKAKYDSGNVLKKYDYVGVYQLSHYMS